jgi:DNA-binding NarL/FixJ family response regulator
LQELYLIADDHDMLRKGISAFLDTNPDFELVGEATTGIEAIISFGFTPVSICDALGSDATEKRSLSERIELVA